MNRLRKFALAKPSLPTTVNWGHWLRGATMMGVWYAIVLHFIWAGLVLVTNNAPKHATAVSSVAELFPAKAGLAIVFATVAGCALLSIYQKRITMLKIALLIPQQLILGVSAAGALRAMYLSHYADGVIRQRGFIIADQLPAVLALVVHSATIIYLAYTMWELEQLEQLEQDDLPR